VQELDFQVGVAFCGNTTAEAKLLIDRVKGYTNLFVVQSGQASNNKTSLNEIVDFAVDSGLNVIVYFGWCARIEEVFSEDSEQLQRVKETFAIDSWSDVVGEFAIGINPKARFVDEFLENREDFGNSSPGFWSKHRHARRQKPLPKPYGSAYLNPTGKVTKEDMETDTILKKVRFQVWLSVCPIGNILIGKLRKRSNPKTKRERHKRKVWMNK
jgi:hypothetical protein